MFQIIIKETRDYLRDKSNVFFFLIFPVILVFLLGNLLSSFDHAEERVGELKIHYVTETESLKDIMSVGKFIDSIQDNKNIIFEESNDLDTSVQMAVDGRVDAVVIFENEPLEIHIHEGVNRIKNRAVTGIMNGFSRYNKAVNIISGNSPRNIADFTDDGTNYIIHKELGIRRTMLDYYAITMLTMICFMSVMLGAVCFMGERDGRTIQRLKIAPINQVKLFFGKVLGLLPQTVLQVVIIMTFSTVLFKARYARDFFDNLYLFFMFVAVGFAMISIGAVYGLFIKVNPMVSMMPIVWLMMFLSGTYSKEIYIEGITRYMPMYQVQEAAFDLAVFGRYKKATAVIVICLILSAIMLAVGAVGFSRKEEL
jgi:ABC-2 type transporter.